MKYSNNFKKVRIVLTILNKIRMKSSNKNNNKMSKKIL